ncbi:HlyD family secretion protein [Pedobacter heparinus]|nr:HlyD family secretion protein [Pedobacter heparinus]
MISLSALIKYPDIVKTQLKITSANAPKSVISKISGQLVKVTVQENQAVITDQPLAYIESTASHEQVLQLLDELKNLQANLSEGMIPLKLLATPKNVFLGELQNAYQSFYQSFLMYQSSIANGFYLKKKVFLQKDLLSILDQKEQLLVQQKLQEKDYELGKKEFEMHQKLFEQKVEAPMELKREESKFIAKRYPLQQTESALLSNSIIYSAKEKEIMELENLISEEKLKFIQALNNFISNIEDWKKKYVLTAPQPGKVAFLGIVQEKEFLNAGQEVLYINPGSTDFFGEIHIPQYKMGKVYKDQEVLIKLKSYPFEEYGIIRGNIQSIADIPYKDSVFVSRVSISNKGMSGLKRNIRLKNGMIADAEIITEDATLLKRLIHNIIKIINK